MIARLLDPRIRIVAWLGLSVALVLFGCTPDEGGGGGGGNGY